MKHTNLKQDLSTFFENSKYHMGDITHKMPTFRRAIAMGRIYVGKVGFTHIKNETLHKGDVLKLAEVAGVQGAKNTWQQIPMCHLLLLDHVAVYTEIEEQTHSVVTYSIVSTTAKTGVEMEALVAVNASLLTIYDLTKPVEPTLTISDIRLLVKEGGKKGLWVHPDGIPEALEILLPIQFQRTLKGRTVAVITMSDRAYRGEYEDKSGIVLKNALENLGCKILDYTILPDEISQLKQKFVDLTGKVELIITTGGTGLDSRDITPETIYKFTNVKIPGIGELLRSSSGRGGVPTAWLSRSLAAIINGTLVISLPGSTGAVKDGIEVLKTILPHALDHIQGKKHLHDKT